MRRMPIPPQSLPLDPVGLLWTDTPDTHPLAPAPTVTELGGEAVASFEHEELPLELKGRQRKPRPLCLRFHRGRYTCPLESTLELLQGRPRGQSTGFRLLYFSCCNLTFKCYYRGKPTHQNEYERAGQGPSSQATEEAQGPAPWQHH